MATARSRPSFDPAATARVAAQPAARRPAIDALREVVLAARPAVREVCKWNSPSYQTAAGVDVATINLAAKDRIRLILHRGAKASAAPAPVVADPAGLLTWLDPARAMVPFADLAEVRAKAPALRALIAAWQAALPGAAG